MVTRKVFCELCGKELELTEDIKRIVSLSPAITETLYVLGLGDMVVCFTSYDVHPSEAKNKTFGPLYDDVFNPLKAE